MTKTTFNKKTGALSALSAALILAVIIPSIPFASANDTTCIGTLVAGTYDTVIVPAAGVCFVASGVTVNGDVNVESNASLTSFISATVNGNINVASGAATVLDFTFGGGVGVQGEGNGIAFLPDNILFNANDEELQTLDQVDGAATFVADLDFSSPADNFPLVNAMDFDPRTGAFFASVDTGVDTFDSLGPNYLATVDTVTGDVDIIGQTVDGLDAIAFAPAAEEPFSVFEIERAHVRLGEGDRYRFEVRGRFELGTTSDGLDVLDDVLNEEVTVTFDGIPLSIPGSDFFRDVDDESFRFKDGFIVHVRIRDDGTFRVNARGLEGGSIDLPGQVPFSLQIGDDLGNTDIPFDVEGLFRQ